MQKNDKDINRLVQSFFSPHEYHPKTDLGLHALDVRRKSMLKSQKKKKKKKKKAPGAMLGSHGNRGTVIVRSATELHEAGVKLRKSRTDSLRDISFKHGVLDLPTIMVDDATESMFLNMMAFERLHVGASNEVTSYVFFMDSIIDSPTDVSLLHWKKIIHNALGSDKAVAKLFNSLSKDVTLDPDDVLDDIHRRVNKYCSKRWNKWRANLLHTYFRNPWTFMSIAAAIFLLGLTVLQTVYTLLPYYTQN